MHYTFHEFIEAIEYNERPRATHDAVELAGDAINYAFAMLDNSEGTFGATWLGGYARVTAVLPSNHPDVTSSLLASPLYVERIPKPE